MVDDTDASPGDAFRDENLTALSPQDTPASIDASQTLILSTGDLSNTPSPLLQRKLFPAVDHVGTAQYLCRRSDEGHHQEGTLNMNDVH